MIKTIACYDLGDDDYVPYGSVVGDAIGELLHRGETLRNKIDPALQADLHELLHRQALILLKG